MELTTTTTTWTLQDMQRVHMRLQRNGTVKAMEATNKTLGELIKAMRTEKGMSREELDDWINYKITREAERGNLA